MTRIFGNMIFKTYFLVIIGIIRRLAKQALFCIHQKYATATAVFFLSYFLNKFYIITKFKQFL